MSLSSLRRAKLPSVTGIVALINEFEEHHYWLALGASAVLLSYLGARLRYRRRNAARLDLSRVARALPSALPHKQQHEAQAADPSFTSLALESGEGEGPLSSYVLQFTHQLDADAVNSDVLTAAGRAVASHLQSDLGLQQTVDADNVCLTAGFTAALITLLRTLLDPGEGVLVPVPCPSCYTAALHLAAAVLCPVAAPCTDALAHSIAPHSLEAAWRRARESDILKPVHVRVLLLTNPHAPSGRLCTSAALHSALLWCRFKGIHLVVDETRAASVHRPGAVFCSAAAVAAAEYSGCDDSSSSSSSGTKRRRSSSSIHSVDATTTAAEATANVADTADTRKVEANSATASRSHNSDQHQQQQEDLTEVTAAVSSSSTITRALCGKAQDVHILYGCDGARQCWRGLNVAAIVSANSSAIAACRKAAAATCPPSQLALLHASFTSTAAGTHIATVAAVEKGALREKYLAVAQCLESCGLLYIQAEACSCILLDLREFLHMQHHQSLSQRLSHDEHTAAVWAAETALWWHILEIARVNLAPVGQALLCTEPGWFMMNHSSADTSACTAAILSIAECLRERQAAAASAAAHAIANVV
eukprot:8632-Heterococcus_DN1.PRE.3